MNEEQNSADQRRVVEAENLGLVRRFFDDWAKRDAELLASYLDDDLIYQMVEGQPDILGKAAFVEIIGPALRNFHSVEMKILRHHAIGQLVISERFDELLGKDAAHSMRISVTSASVVYNGKIAILRDYPIRGGTLEIGESFF